MNNNLEEMKKAEAEFFDKSARRRTASGQIPMEADIRRATRFIPSSSDQEPIFCARIGSGWNRMKP